MKIEVINLRIVNRLHLLTISLNFSKPFHQWTYVAGGRACLHLNALSATRPPRRCVSPSLPRPPTLRWPTHGTARRPPLAAPTFLPLVSPTEGMPAPLPPQLPLSLSLSRKRERERERERERGKERESCPPLGCIHMVLHGSCY
jgi:hypothetical protein